LIPSPTIATLRPLLRSSQSPTLLSAPAGVLPPLHLLRDRGQPMKSQLACLRSAGQFSNPSVALPQPHSWLPAAKHPQFGCSQELAPRERRRLPTPRPHRYHLDGQTPRHTVFHEERQTTHQDLLALITHPDSSSGRVGEFIGLHEWNGKFRCPCHNCLGERMFGLALRNAGSGYDLLLPEAIG
jgi:hypothetical protein